MTMEAVSKSIVVFYIPMIIVLLLVTYVPALFLWRPGLFRWGPVHCLAPG
jgi:TRAP-type C4-dicarboxylate transport system permease large subunit